MESLILTPDQQKCRDEWFDAEQKWMVKHLEAKALRDEADKKKAKWVKSHEQEGQ